jgi:hypothetical protein
MTTDDVVFLLDVDNTLLDNDRVTADLKQHLAQEVGSERQKCYWTIYEHCGLSLGMPITLARCSDTGLNIRAIRAS